MSKISHPDYRTNWVYIFECGPFVKIGFANDAGKRLKAAEAMNPFDIRVHMVRRFPQASSAKRAERLCHKALADHRHRLEWFLIPASDAGKVVSRVCADVRLTAYRDRPDIVPNAITTKELLSPRLPDNLKGKLDSLEEWKWRRDRRKAYMAASQAGDLQVAG